jgi:hypothetical protein
MFMGGKGEDIVLYNSPILYARFPRHSTLPPTLNPQPTVDRPTPPTLSLPQPDQYSRKIIHLFKSQRIIARPSCTLFVDHALRVPDLFPGTDFPVL